MRILTIIISVFLFVFCFYLGVQLQERSEQVQKIEALNGHQQEQIEALTGKIENLQRKIRWEEVLEVEKTSYSKHEVFNIVNAILDATETYDLEPELILAVIMTESDFNKNAVSNRGAFGLMQLLPSTARELARELNMEWSGLKQLQEPGYNIKLGSYYLRKLMRGYNNLDLALTAYNMGPGRLDALRQSDEAIPSDYSSKVREYYRAVKGKAGSSSS